MVKSLGIVAVGIGLLAAGCADKELDKYDGNSALGIAQFELSDDAYQTSLVGLDASGAEVARLDLVHGQFKLSPTFAGDYGVSEIDGRKLTVKFGEEELAWETGGYDPVLGLPAHPSNEGALAMFLDDPHAKAVLDAWKIGFEPFEGAVAGDLFEIDYTTLTAKGDSRQSCNGVSVCGADISRNGSSFTINMCGGHAASIQAARITQRSGTNCGLYTSSYNQVQVQQCCPAEAGVSATPWFGRKTCALAAANNCDPDGTGPLTASQGTMTECGCQKNTVACKACPSYPHDASWYCGVSSTSGATGSCNGTTVYPISSTYYISGADWCSQYPGYQWCPDVGQCLTSCGGCQMCGGVCC